MTLSRALLRQGAVFAAVGATTNVVYAGLYVALLGPLAAPSANAVALVLSTVVATAGHRRVTFGVRGRARAGRHQALGLGLLAFGVGVTSGSLSLLHGLVAAPSIVADLSVLAVANAAVGVVRFAALRAAMLPSATLEGRGSSTGAGAPPGRAAAPSTPQTRRMEPSVMTRPDGILSPVALAG